jgi:hypothetical protein
LAILFASQIVRFNKNGYVSQDYNSGPSKVDLGKLINDGQTIEMSDDLGNSVDFVKQ